MIPPIGPGGKALGVGAWLGAAATSGQTRRGGTKMHSSLEIPESPGLLQFLPVVNTLGISVRGVYVTAS
jgi:hypothetical protein